MNRAWRNKGRPLLIPVLLVILALTPFVSGCKPSSEAQVKHEVPHEQQWGIYELSLATQEVKLIYSSPDDIQTSALHLNSAGTSFVFAMKPDGSSDNATEIYSIGTDGANLTRLTNNDFWDL